MADFANRDPAQAAFWDERFAAGFTPWDSNGVPAAFARWLAAAQPAAGTRVLVPGCGSAYEVAAFAALGCDVLAIDYSAAAIERARRYLPAEYSGLVQQADFFTFEALPYDVIYERALLAALPPGSWPKWKQGCARLLRAGGVLAGFFFVDDAAAEPRRGPPFAITSDELGGLLAGEFSLEGQQAIPVAESLPVFAGRERWMVWQRR